MKLNRFFILCAALLEFSLAVNAQSPASVFTNVAPATVTAVPRRSSIILIQCEGLGCGDLSCYGQTKFSTPNLDRLAAGGIRFTNYYSGDAASSPARAALMLGKDSRHLRQRADVEVPLAPEEITVAQMLRQSGYHSGLIGEWNLGGENSSGAPWKKGFDEFAGYFDANDAKNFYADYIWRYTQHFTYDKLSGQWTEWKKEDAPHAGGKETIYSNTGGKRGQFIPDLLTKAALNFIQVNQPDPFNRYRPFFLLVNYKMPGDGKSRVPTDAPFSDEPWPPPAKNKAAMIVRLDGYIGQLMEQLRKLGLTNNTAVFFTSATVPKKTDAVAPEFFHSVASTNDLRVPMIVDWPGQIPAGAVSDFKWSAPDFLPTAAEIAFAQSPTNIDGTSVLPALLGQARNKIIWRRRESAR